MKKKLDTKTDWSGKYAAKAYQVYSPDGVQTLIKEYTGEIIITPIAPGAYKRVTNLGVSTAVALAFEYENGNKGLEVAEINDVSYINVVATKISHNKVIKSQDTAMEAGTYHGNAFVAFVKAKRIL